MQIHGYPKVNDRIKVVDMKTKKEYVGVVLPSPKNPRKPDVRAYGRFINCGLRLDNGAVKRIPWTSNTKRVQYFEEPAGKLAIF